MEEWLGKVLGDPRPDVREPGASDQLQLAKHAGAGGLDARQFRRDMRGQVHLARVRMVREEGVRRGVVDVPTFFINSLQHESAFGLATLLPAVQVAAGGS